MEPVHAQAGPARAAQRRPQRACLRASRAQRPVHGQGNEPPAGPPRQEPSGACQPLCLPEPNHAMVGSIAWRGTVRARGPLEGRIATDPALPSHAQRHIFLTSTATRVRRA